MTVRSNPSSDKKNRSLFSAVKSFSALLQNVTDSDCWPPVSLIPGTPDGATHNCFLWVSFTRETWW